MVSVKTRIVRQAEQQAKQLNLEASRQARMLTVTPEAAFAPAYASILPGGDSLLPILIGGGVLLYLILKK